MRAKTKCYARTSSCVFAAPAHGPGQPLEPVPGLTFSMRPRHTTAMNGGSAENTGAIFCPYVLYIKKAPFGAF